MKEKASNLILFAAIIGLTFVFGNEYSRAEFCEASSTYVWDWDYGVCRLKN